MSAGLLLLGAIACRSVMQQRQQLASANPLDQVTAAVWLAEVGDAEAVHRLVSLLEDRDRTVRMYAILALERLCGQTYGYRYHASDAERGRAVRRWREALRQGEVVVPPPGELRPHASGAGSDGVADSGSAGPDTAHHE